MARRRTKTFDFVKGIYYFNIKKGYNNTITIKRMKKEDAIHAFNGYLTSQRGNCEWLGKWDGKKFTEDNFEKLAAAKTA